MHCVQCPSPCDLLKEPVFEVFARTGRVEPLRHVGFVDAMDGDHRRFARADEVLEAWRVVQPVIDNPPPIQLYENGTWGPDDADELAAECGGWHDPT